jgi:hypothetical protein
MKVQIQINGKLFPLWEAEITEQWLNSTNCEECFLNPRNCSNLCHRAFMEFKQNTANLPENAASNAE